MLKLILSLIVCNISLFYFHSISSVFEKFFKLKFSSSSKIIIGYSIFILFSYYFYFFLRLEINIINSLLIISLILFIFNVKNYVFFFFLTKENIFINLIILTILFPGIVYGEQFYIFRGNYWDSSSYLISGLLFKNYSFNDVIYQNFPVIYNEFENIKRITTGRPLVHYLLSLFLNLKFTSFYSYYLFKCFISIIIFLSLFNFLKKFFFKNQNSKILFLSFLFIFSFWNVYIFEIDALSHYASIPLLIFLVKIFFSLDIKKNLKENYLLISLVAAALFIIYPEIFFIPAILYLIIFFTKFKTISKKELINVSIAGLLFVFLTIPSYATNYEYLLFSQLNQSLRLNDWWGYFGSFIFGKENLVLNDIFVEEIKSYINVYKKDEIIKFIHTSHFAEKYYFIYLNILPSLSGLYFLMPGKIVSSFQLIFNLIILIFLSIYLINIIFKNLNHILSVKNNLKKIFIYFLIIFFIMLTYLFLNNNYWSIIKFYTFLFPFLFIFFSIDFRKKKINIFYIFLISFFCLYKFTVFNYGIGKYDSFPSILNSSLKKEINWSSISYEELKNCKKVSLNKDDYIINTYLNLKLLNLNKLNKDAKDCKLALEKNNFIFINE